MPSYASFSPSVVAINGHTTAFGTIADNIANVSSEGYKPIDTQFSELVHGGLNTQFQTFNGMKADVRHLIDRQGEILRTGRKFDVGIAGDGFFVVNTQLDGSGETLLTRGGSFQQRLDDSGNSFLADLDGNFVQGWPADTTGNFIVGPGITSLGPIQIDPASATFNPVASTTASVNVNLDSDAAVGTTFNSSVDVFDSAGNNNALVFDFTKAGTNAWNLNISSPTGTITSGTPAAFTFDALGNLATPASITVAANWNDPAAAASTITVDTSTITQFAGVSLTRLTSSDGFGAGTLLDFRVNPSGAIEGLFTNGASRNLFKLPVATVRSTAGLEPRAGTHYAITENAGDLLLREADLSEIADFVPESLENSSTDIAGEFAKMIITQRAYSSAAKAIQVVNEMFQIATQMR